MTNEDLQEQNDEFRRVLEIIANHSNWTGGVWTPVLRGTALPVDLADKVLNDNK